MGRQLRIQQRRRGAPAVRLAHQRLHPRRGVDQQPQHAPRRYTTARGSTTSTTPLVWDSPLRLTTRRALRAAAVRRSGRRTRRRRSASAASRKLAHRTQLTGFFSFGFWNNDEPLQPFTINSALPVAPAAADYRRRPRRSVFSTNLNFVSRPRPTGASLRGCAATTTTTKPRTRPSRTSSPTTPRWRTSTTGGPGALRAQSHDVRRRRHLDRPPATGPHRRLHAQRQRLRLPHLPRARRENVLRLTADAIGWQWVTFRAHYESPIAPAPAWTRVCSLRSASSRRMRHFDHRQPQPQSIHRAGGRHAERGLDLQRLGWPRQRRLSTTATSACRTRRSGRSRSVPTTSQPNGFGAGGTL